MPDNVIANAGIGGSTFGTDEIGGVHYPRTKIIVGADGANDGDVSTANPMPAVIVNAALPQTVYGHADITVTVASATLTALLATAGITVDALTDILVLIPHGTVAMAFEEAAVVGSGEIGVTEAYHVGVHGGVPDLRLKAAANTLVTVKQVG